MAEHARSEPHREFLLPGNSATSARNMEKLFTVILAYTQFGKKVTISSMNSDTFM